MSETPLSEHLQENGAHASIAQFLQHRFADLSEEITDRFSAEMDAASAAAGYASRRAAHEEMNQILRRLRPCRSTEEVAVWLVDSTSSFATRAALFEVSMGQVRGVRARGFQLSPEGFEQLEIPIERAPALDHCSREQDTVVAIGSAAEVSRELVVALAHAPDEKVYLYPIIIDDKTVALLYAMGGETAGRQYVDGAALELLTHAAATAAQILSSAASAPVRVEPDLVRIEGVVKSGRRDAMLRQAREARARWQARTAVADIRIRKMAAVEGGRKERNIYSALKPEIDAARRTYRQDFLAVSPAMADYLHKELLNLANDDPSLLGPDYPGSMS